MVIFIIDQRGGRFKALLSIFPKHITSIKFCGKCERYINDLHNLYDLTYTNFLKPAIADHIDKNKHNLNTARCNEICG